MSAALPPLRMVISYRREDTPGGAGRLRESLAQHFGKENVFFDIDTIPPGVPWRRAIERTVSECDVLLPVIGLHWLSVTDEEGRRRLDRPDDVLRFEIASALQGGVWIIPVQLHGAPMPRAADLPDDIAALVDYQSIRIDDDEWPRDVERLVRALNRIRDEKARQTDAAGGAKAPEALPTVVEQPPAAPATLPAAPPTPPAAPPTPPAASPTPPAALPTPPAASPTPPAAPPVPPAAPPAPPADAGRSSGADASVAKGQRRKRWRLTGYVAGGLLLLLLLFIWDQGLWALIALGAGLVIAYLKFRRNRRRSDRGGPSQSPSGSR